jgi:hypothetical protein
MLIGFAVMFGSGALLYAAIPVRTTVSLWFRLKILLILAAGINAWLFHRHLAASDPRLDAALGSQLRTAAASSLALWMLIIVMGRFIAYEWFDCGQANPAFVDWFAGCRAAGLASIE